MPIQLILVFLILHASSSFADDEPVYIYLPGMEEFSKSCENICYQYAWDQCGSRARYCTLHLPPEWVSPDVPPCGMEERTHAISCMSWHEKSCQQNEVACRSKPEPSVVAQKLEQACRDFANYGVGVISTDQCNRYAGRIRGACFAVGAVVAIGTHYVKDICGWHR